MKSFENTVRIDEERLVDELLKKIFLVFKQIEFFSVENLKHQKLLLSHLSSEIFSAKNAQGLFDDA
eukprot:snap_masked-scaffold_32-processed-gene-1.32-mRNA-1 protein AED:1.00 eAED:1.00 QI:0/-1/0/0/-1/1/1/0/65